MDLNTILRRAVDFVASDVHVKLWLPPMLRRDGTVVPQGGDRALTDADLDDCLRAVTLVAPHRYDQFGDTGDLDIAYTSGDLPRFRVNAFRQRGAVSFAFRVIPKSVPKIADLGLAVGVQKLAEE